MKITVPKLPKISELKFSMPKIEVNPKGNMETLKHWGKIIYGWCRSGFIALIHFRPTPEQRQLILRCAIGATVLFLMLLLCFTETGYRGRNSQVGVHFKNNSSQMINCVSMSISSGECVLDSNVKPGRTADLSIDLEKDEVKVYIGYEYNKRSRTAYLGKSRYGASRDFEVTVDDDASIKVSAIENNRFWWEPDGVDSFVRYPVTNARN